MGDFFKFILESKKKIGEILFTHLVSIAGLIGFFTQGWFEGGGITFHNVIVILTLAILFIVPPLTWYRLYTVYKRAIKYREGGKKR